MSKRTEFIKSMGKGNKYIYLIQKYKNQLESEEEKNMINIELDFNSQLNKGITKYN